ncbi:MAG: acetyltransferase [Gemmatimonadaceae bacterium]
MNLLIFGAGGFGREIAWLANESRDKETRYCPVAFIDEQPEQYGYEVHELPVLIPEDAAIRHPGAAFVVAIGSPKLRKRIVGDLLQLGFKPANLIHRGCAFGPQIKIGKGVVVCAGTTVTTDATIGDYSQVNLHCTIGHDAVLEPFATLAPGVHISGWVEIGEGAYLGTGAVVINGSVGEPVRIGRESVIGAGAVVTKSVPNGETWIGVPARPK